MIPGLLGACALLNAQLPQLQVSFTEYPIPSRTVPRAITPGPDGALWFTTGRTIGKITTAGQITEYPIPVSTNSSVANITAGPDGALWFVENNTGKVGRITTAGVITEFPLPSSSSSPFAITTGPDGNLWFTEPNGSKIGRITTAGVITEFSANAPFLITAGPDGNLWVTETNVHLANIGRMSTVPDKLCLNNNHFCVHVTWQAAPHGNGIASGIASPITANTGAFWFFSPDNIELVVKVLDGRSVNGKFWVFYGALSNVEYTITVTDTQTGAVKTYFNLQGQLASVADTGAF